MLAVIKTGGKQYLVTPGEKIKIEKIDSKAKTSASKGKEKEESQEVIFDQVLLLEKGNKIEIGNPLVKGAKVIGKVISQGKGKKIIVFKYKPKTRYKKKAGHRQPYTLIEIKEIQISKS